MLEYKAQKRGRIYMNKTILKQKQLNCDLAALFQSLGIRNLRLLSLGNSIGSGYSMVRTTKPLLLRNESLTDIMTSHGISLETRHFARAQNNNDEHVFEWLVTNIKESEIHKQNRNDYSMGPTSMSVSFLTPAQLDEYYPVNMEDDIGLQDAILEFKCGLANIVIYNGCTGSFLDNVTRNGKFSHKFTYGINRDIESLESTLKFVQAANRDDKSDTQIYICGAPDYLGLKITEIINRKLKKVAQKYSNAVYVKPVKSKLFYQPLYFGETSIDASKKKAKVPDIHYDEEEYLEFNNHIIKSIYDSYSISKAMICVDRELYHFSSVLELKEQRMLDNSEVIQNYLEMVLSLASSKLTDDTQLKLFYKVAKKYLRERFPYDFYYIGKNNIEESFQKVYRSK